MCTCASVGIRARLHRGNSIYGDFLSPAARRTEKRVASLRRNFSFNYEGDDIIRDRVAQLVKVSPGIFFEAV